MTTLPARWWWVIAVSCFINTSYGTMSYAFSVLVTKDGPGGEFGAGVVSAAFGLALLVSGIAAIFIGTAADLFGVRRLMAGGAILGAAGLALLAACTEAWQFVAVMLCLIGPAMAATFYEPIYVLMNRWFAATERPRAYGVLTLLSGFSITIFTPLTRWLVHAYGWREGVIVLGAILLAVGLVVPLVITEPAPEAPAGRSARAFLAETREGLAHANASFWAFTAVFFVATVAFSGVSFHMVSAFEARGFDAGSVAAVIAVAGIVSLPARLLLPMLSGRAPSIVLLGVCLALLGVAAWLASAAVAWWQVWLFVAVFGAVFGAIYPLRALVVAERFAGPYFGRLIGVQALFVALGRAAGPVAIAAIGTSKSSYELAFRVAAATLFVSAFATWAAMRRSARAPVPAPVDVL